MVLMFTVMPTDIPKNNEYKKKKLQKLVAKVEQNIPRIPSPPPITIILKDIAKIRERVTILH